MSNNPTSGGSISGQNSGGPYHCYGPAHVPATAEPNLGYLFNDWSVTGGSVSSTTDTSTTLTVPCPGDATLTANYLSPATLNLWNWTDNSFDTSSALPPLSSFSSTWNATQSGIHSSTYISYTPCFNNFTLTSELANGTNAENIFYNSYCYWDSFGTHNGNVTMDVSMVEDVNTNHWVSTMWANFFQENGEQVNAGDLLNQSFTSNLDYLLDHQEVNGQGGGLIQELSTVGQNYASSSNSTLKTQGVEYEDLSSALGDFENAVSGNSTILDTIVEGYSALVDNYVPNIVCSTIIGAQIVGIVMFPEEDAEIIGTETIFQLSSVLGRLFLFHFIEGLGSAHFGCTPFE